MVHHEILEEIRKKRQDGSFIYPDYGRYSIAEIPPTVLSFFDVPHERASLSFEAVGNPDKYQNLIFFFIDGFAYDHFIEYGKELPFFSNLHDADIFPLT